jgi:hypothetical protein
LASQVALRKWAGYWVRRAYGAGIL